MRGACSVAEMKRRWNMLSLVPADKKNKDMIRKLKKPTYVIYGFYKFFFFYRYHKLENLR